MHVRRDFETSTTTLAKRVVALLTLAASSLALAQAVPTIGADTKGKSGEKVPWRGSSISYGHSATAMTFAPGAKFEIDPALAADPRISYDPTAVGTQQYYNPTWSHRLGLMPEWHFTDAFYVRSRFFISQEFTLSDSTSTRNEVEVSDLWLDGVWGGWKEKNTGIKLGADLRVMLPTSFASRMQTRLFTLGPGVNVSKMFPVLSGLAVSYSGRFTYRFNRLATFQNAGPSFESCGVRGNDDCLALSSQGVRAIQLDALHGPSVLFMPHPRVFISGTFLMQHGYLPPLAESPVELSLTQDTGPQWRHFWAGMFSVTWQTWDTLGFTLGAFTFANQLGPNGQLVFPLFNRNTVVSLDATLDIEAFINNLKPTEKKS